MMKKKILVIEDEPVIAELINMLLEQEGYQVISFNNNAGVKERLQDNEIALVLLDLTLGGQDGMDVCDHIKNNKDLKHIPVVLVSAHRDLEKIAGECAADGFILKPFDLATFGKTVQGYIR
jgi:DNA-binding response OmpR family regulator